jgi:hypothetical protein
MEYKIVSVGMMLTANSALEKLGKTVNQEIARGWEPLGGPVVLRDMAICQALIKRR